MHVRDGRYVYTSRRIAGRVRTIYVGMVGSQAVADYERTMRMRSEARHAADDLPAIDGELKALQLQAMTEAGYHRTKHRKWRRRYETGDTNDN